MHILLIHQAFASLNEPGGTRHHEFARHLVKLGHQITIIASPISYLTGTNGGKLEPKTEEQFNEPGIQILRAYTYHALHRSFAHRVISFISFMVSSFILGLRVKDVDLVWGTSPPIFQGATAWSLARIKGAKFLFEIRDLWPAFAVAVGVLKQPFLIRVSELFEKFLYTHADQIMVNSPGFIDHVRKHGGTKIALIPNGSDPDMFDPLEKGECFRKNHGLGDKFIALYAGAHGLSNDLNVVLYAAYQLREHNNIVIVFLGDGKEKLNLMKQASKMGIDNVRFIQPVPKSKMPEALGAANACIGILKPIPLYATVYPNKIFDYMSASRPVILAMEGVIRDVVERAGAGICVPPGNADALAKAIHTLAKNPDDSKAMGLAGRKYIEQHFDRAVLAKQLVQVFETVVNPSNPPN